MSKNKRTSLFNKLLFL